MTEFQSEPPGPPDEHEPLPLPTDPDDADRGDADRRDPNPETDVVPSGTEEPEEPGGADR